MATGAIGAVDKSKIITLDQVTASETPRIITGMDAVDAVWGGGMVKTSVTLLGAEPGTGKSTMMLQLSSIIARITGRKAYYLSAEQPANEVKLLTDRLKLDNVDQINVLREFGSGAEIDKPLLKEVPPCLFTIDSLTDMCGKDNDAQIAIAKTYKRYSVEFEAPTVLICHMTKEGDLTGLKKLQHTVDALITLGHVVDDREIRDFLDKGYPEELLNEDLRILHGWKNRNGPTGKDYYLRMAEHGLEVLPPPKQKKKKGILGRGMDKAEAPPDRESGEQLIRRQEAAIAEAVAELDSEQEGKFKGAKRHKASELLEMEHNGQKLVNRKKAGGKKADKADAKTDLEKDDVDKLLHAVGGEAVKKRRPAMPKSPKKKDAPAKREQPSKRPKKEVQEQKKQRKKKSATKSSPSAGKRKVKSSKDRKER